ncbi:MAG: GNAT family N-acetyltransferase [Holophagaceae bacterium]|nr:GNAT family N-acetyltransferase [Holophagaceae bacterium]
MYELGSIKIRPYELGDAQGLFDAARESVSTVGAWLWWCTSDFTIETATAWVEHQVSAFRSNAEYEFVIVSEKGLFLGGCGLNSIDERNARANLGYWVRSSTTLRGVATEAVLQVAQWAFQNTDLIRLEIVIAKDNRASLRVAEKAGAVREGVLRQRLHIQDTFQDSVMFSILKADVSRA